jgi:hypothetical protein
VNSTIQSGKSPGKGCKCNGYQSLSEVILRRLSRGFPVITILLDADLILDALMNRQEFTQNMRGLLDGVHPLIEMYITDIGWQKIYTYARCLKNTDIAEIVVHWLQGKIEVCQVNQCIIQQARSLPLRDFESAVEFSCARYWQLNAIVTHKPEDFAISTNQLWVWSIADLCLRANLENQFQSSNYGSAK